MIKKLITITAVLNLIWIAEVHSREMEKVGRLEALQMQFIDSATGYAVQPDGVEFEGHSPASEKKRFGGAGIGKSGRLSAELAPGNHSVHINTPGYLPMSGAVAAGSGEDYPIRFMLTPVVEPRELQAEFIDSVRRPDSTVFVGFVVDDESGEPVSRVRVRSNPSGVETRTDDRGFFLIHVPVQDEVEAETSPAGLSFERGGYRSLDRNHLELWPGGDWAYRIRLNKGNGRAVVDERQLRRRAPTVSSTAPSGGEASRSEEPASSVATASVGAEDDVSAAGTTNQTIRVPRTIRVLYNSVVYYETMEGYTKRSLTKEWIPSWGSYTGGSNALNSGAVAVRTYAIGYVNNPSSSSYDICGTTSCQVYDPTASSSYTDTAVNYTAGFVMVNSSGNLTYKLTEYSAENNSIGFSCGDGYTQPTGGCIYDPVCTGESRFGHGRGLCQWGSARWATARRMAGRSSSDGTPTGHPRQSWTWILQQYYPALTLVKGAPLLIGDDIKVIGATANVRMCLDGSISSGVNCPLVTTKTVGSTGTIIDGPVHVISDGAGHTWWKILWTGGQVGWAAENWLDRVLTIPSAPSGLIASSVSTTQINLSWGDNSADEFGFKLERAPASGGPWTQVASTMANTNAFADTGLVSGTTYYYRVRSFNGAGNSGYSNTASASTQANPAPVISSHPASQTKGQGQAATFVVSATGAAPLGYQWRRNGVNLANGGTISGATDPMLNLSSVQTNDAGSYTVVVSNASGSVTSAVAVLTVTGVIVWQDDFDANTAASWATNRSSADTRVTFNYNYANDGIPPAPHSVSGTTRGVKFEANLTAGAAAAINISPLGQAFAGDFKLRFDMWINANGPFPGGGTGSTEHLTAGVGTAGNRVQWTGGGSTADGYWFAVNGEGGSTDTTTTTLADYAALSGTTLHPAASGIYAAGTASNSRGNLNSYYTGVFPGGQSAPAQQQTGFPQQNGALAVGTVGFAWRDVLISKQGSVVEWFIDGLKVATINGAAFAGSNIFIGYWDSFTSVSDNAALSFGLVDNIRVEIPGVPPAITSQPVGRAVAAGSNVTFTVTASGTAPLGYQWRFNGTTVSGATAASHTVTNAQSANAGEYSVVVSNVAGAVASSNAVLSVNNPPVLGAVASRAIHAGASVTVTNSASDADAPGQALSYSLLPGAPIGATIHPATGVFSWSSGDEDAGSEKNVTVRVTDNGNPPLSDQKGFTISVVGKPTLQGVSVGGGNATLNWSAIPGTRYRIQYKGSLSDAVWTDLSPDVTASGATASKADPIGAGQRFYRILVVD